MMCVVAITLLVLGKLLLALPFIIAGSILIIKRKYSKEQQILLTMTEKSYMKNGSAILTLRSLSGHEKIDKAFKKYWTGIFNSVEEDDLEGKISNVLLHGAITGEAQAKSIELLRNEEKIKEYKKYALGKANSMIFLSIIGLSFFFPFFAGIGLSIVNENSLIGGKMIVSNAFELVIFLYIFEALIISKAFYNLDKGVFDILLDILLPASIAISVFRVSSFVYAII
ncbi:MAG: hypothetical protein ACP5RT_01500 [Candidatus Micrarchaeia archaeon]